MKQHKYMIKNMLRLALGVDAFLLLFLAIISAAVNGSALEKTLFTVFFIPTAYLFLESLLRRITIDEECLSIFRLFREKRLPWESITHVGGLAIKNKAYLLLTTTAGFFIISNSYGSFSVLKDDILSHVDSGRIEDDARALVEGASANINGSALAWVAAFLLTGIIMLKIYPFIL